MKKYTNVMKKLEEPKSYRFYFFAEMWADLPEIQAKRYQKLRQRASKKLKEYYLLKSFFALQNNYEILK
jgi:hypothetical protein